MTIPIAISITTFDLPGGRRTQVNAILRRGTLAAGRSTSHTCRGGCLCLVNRSCI